MAKDYFLAQLFAPVMFLLPKFLRKSPEEDANARNICIFIRFHVALRHSAFAQISGICWFNNDLHTGLFNLLLSLFDLI
jgi:hypothetical protein